MKFVLGFCLTLLVAFPAAAADIRSDNVFFPLGGSYEVLIPAAGSTAGANGTFFRSDVTLVNLSDHAIRVRVNWLSQGGTSNATRVIEVPQSSGLRSADFVSEVIGQSGLGAIVLTAVRADDSVDTTAVLQVASRIWTPQPGSTGSMSQSFPSIPTSLVNSPSAAIFGLGGADQPSRYRVNVGIVNLDPVNTQTLNVYIPTPFLPPVIQVIVPPMSMKQVSMGSVSDFANQVAIANTTQGPTRSNKWIAYGSTVDNVTGDAWSEISVAGQ